MRKTMVCILALALTAPLILASCGNDNSKMKNDLNALRKAQERNHRELAARLDKLETLHKTLSALEGKIAANTEAVADLDEKLKERLRDADMAGREGRPGEREAERPVERVVRDVARGANDFMQRRLAGEFERAGLDGELAQKAAQIRIKHYAEMMEAQAKAGGKADEIEKLRKNFETNVEGEIKKELGEEGYKKYKTAQTERDNKRYKPMADAIGVDVETAKKISGITSGSWRESMNIMREARKEGKEINYRDIRDKVKKKTDAQIKKLLGDDEKKYKAYQEYQRNRRGRWGRRGRRGGEQPRDGEKPKEGEKPKAGEKPAGRDELF